MLSLTPTLEIILLCSLLVDWHSQLSTVLISQRNSVERQVGDILTANSSQILRLNEYLQFLRFLPLAENLAPTRYPPPAKKRCCTP